MKTPKFKLDDKVILNDGICVNEIVRITAVHDKDEYGYCYKVYLTAKQNNDTEDTDDYPAKEYEVKPLTKLHKVLR
jgi:hypothetical protein